MAASDQISAVIPAYNREALVGRAIESVLAQSVVPGEIVVVDDGSTDATAAVAERYPGVRCLRQRNAGPGAARNAGVDAASGEWIAFLDSDDVWLPRHLERLWAAVDGTGGRARYYFADVLRPVEAVLTSHWSRCGFDPGGDVVLVDDGGDWTLLPRRPQMLQASLISRRHYRSVGGIWPRLRMTEDGHLFAKLSIGQPVCAVAGAGAEMTDDADPESRLFATGRHRRSVPYVEELAAMYADLLDRFPEATERQRAVLRQRHANAHRRLVRFLTLEGHPAAAARHVWPALAGDPRTFFERARRRIMGGRRS